MQIKPKFDKAMLSTGKQLHEVISLIERDITVIFVTEVGILPTHLDDVDTVFDGKDDKFEWFVENGTLYVRKK